MAQSVIQPVILCGGCGTRLWPLSRAQFPKQFLRMFGKESLFQLALKRLGGLQSESMASAKPLVVGNEDHRFLVLDQLHDIGVEPAAVLLEPVGRNTAPALALAVHAARDGQADPILVVCPADQVVADVPGFVEAVTKAVTLAETGTIVLLGIAPTRPETGYGYMRVAQQQTMPRVEAFVEKPDLPTAERYIGEGCYYWNSGIFVLKASVWQAAFSKFRPDITKAVQCAWDARVRDTVFIRPGRAEFEAVPAESIDYAVMEKCIGTCDVRMVPLAAGWSDLGSWDAAWQASEKDGQGNASVGDVMLKNSSNVFVHASSRLVSVVGLENVIVVETPDAVLVVDRARSQEVKHIVAELNAGSRDEHRQHRKVYRPWGWYDSIDQGERFKVKRIMVKPGASLSLQKHHKRAEHWVVVSGTAEIVCGDKTMRLTENQSTYIPLGEVHRLSNPGTVPLEIIEVQSGDYLGEDDIVRLEDHYGRH